MKFRDSTFYLNLHSEGHEGDFKCMPDQGLQDSVLRVLQTVGDKVLGDFANVPSFLDKFNIKKQWDDVAIDNDSKRNKSPKDIKNEDDDDDFDDEDEDEPEEEEETEEHEDL